MNTPRWALTVMLCATALSSPALARPDEGKMPLGDQAPPPNGFIDMCERMPRLCVPTVQASAGELEAVRQWARESRASIALAEGRRADGPVVTQTNNGVIRISRVSRPTAATVNTPRSPWLLRRGQPVMMAARPPAAGDAPAPAVTLVIAPAPASAVAQAQAQAQVPAVAAPPSASRVFAGRWDLMNAWLQGVAASAAAVPAPAATEAAPPAADDQIEAALDKEPVERTQAPRYTLGAARLNQINRSINRNIRRSSDVSAFGREEYWTVPAGDRARGDCEDYALAKRQALIDAGVPAEAMSLAVVQTNRREMHAVLLVATPEGEVVLDNLTPWIVSWRDAPYTWLQRQAPGSTLTWVYPDMTARTPI